VLLTGFVLYFLNNETDEITKKILITLLGVFLGGGAGSFLYYITLGKVHSLILIKMMFIMPPIILGILFGWFALSRRRKT
jgi:hypothetical protein